MQDKFGRKIEYLRLSITDRCNLRCKYCMGEDFVFLPKDELLNASEIKTIVEIFSELGVKKIRITGGEPLVRNNFREIISNISSIQGIENINITTNGIRLEQELEFLVDKKINSLNISLDTLNPELYREITVNGELSKVLRSIEKAISLKIPRIKLNIVLMKGKNDSEIMEFVKFSEKYPVDIRFIELMPIGLGKEYQSVSTDEILEIISKERKLIQVESKIGYGPAKYYKTEYSKGYIGFINPLSHSFCSECNRVRITPEGFLKLCLHWKDGIDLKKYLRGGATKEELKNVIENAIYKKPEEHNMNDYKEKDVDSRFMNEIGG